LSKGQRPAIRTISVKDPAQKKHYIFGSVVGRFRFKEKIKPLKKFRFAVNL